MDKSQKHRTIIFYKSYFADFFNEQKAKVQDKIIWTFDLIEELQRVPETYLKHIENTEGLFEIRVQQGSDIFRIFCFFDKGNSSFWQMDSRRKHKRRLERKLKKH